MMKRTLQRRAKKGWLTLFSAFILLLSWNASQAQDNDSLGMMFTPTMVPTDPMAGDSVCYEWKITNNTKDTLYNVTIADAVIDAMAPQLLPFGETASSSGMLTGSMAVKYTGSGSFMFTGSGCQMLTSTDIDNGFICIPGTATAQGTPPMTDARFEGTYTSTDKGVICFGVQLTCKDFNVSVNSKCETELTPSLLNIDSALWPVVKITIDEGGGVFRDPPMVGVDDVGMKLKVVVGIPGCPEVPDCWSFANVEYKLGPELICGADTISCAENVAMMEPIVTDACGATTFIRLSTTRTDLCRSSSEFVAVDTVVYAVQDQFGNISDTCAQLRYIEKPNLKDSDIMWPGDQTLDCKNLDFDEEGNLAISVIGYPKWDGVSFERINRESCNVFAEFKQYTDLGLNCVDGNIVRRITGQWFIYEWKCEGGINELMSPPVSINFIDTVPPVISGLPGTLEFTVDDFVCGATFTPPMPDVTDACNVRLSPGTVLEPTLQYRFLDTILNNEGQAVTLPPGVHNLEYIAQDACGNTSIDTVVVTVVDNTIPVAICLKENTVSITNQSAFIRAGDLDQDSYDPCGIDSIAIRRAESICNPMDTLWQDQVEFCCEDINKEIMVGLRVWDKDGNWNECWVNVFVKGGEIATVTCIVDTVVMTCEYIYDESDPSSLEKFGIIETDLNPDTINILPESQFVEFRWADGNNDPNRVALNGTTSTSCGVTVEELPPVVDIDSFCRTGTIDRIIEVTDAFGFVTVCRQHIIIQGDETENPVVFTYVPPNDTITGLDGRTVRSIAKDDPARTMNNGCSQVGVGYKDKIFESEKSEFCAKIQRSWFLIDWCRGGAIPVDTAFQLIYVKDQEAPVISDLTSGQLVLPSAINITVEDNVATNIRDLDISFSITGSGGSLSETLNSNNTVYTDNTAEFILKDVLPNGDYTLTWKVKDPCEMEAEQSVDIQIVDAFRETTVTGQVLFAEGGVMDDVNVYLSEEASDYNAAEMKLTNIDGLYAFDTPEMGSSYYVEPKKTGDFMNGISSVDILLIQRHILGVEELESPRLKIAADVNNDGKISLLDLLELRKMILGYTTEFANNDSWAFVWDGQDLQDIVDHGARMKSNYHIEELAEKMQIDWLGIKIGDVTGDAQGHSTQAGGRSLDQETLTYEVVPGAQGYLVHVRATENTSLYGLQAELNWGDQIAGLNPGVLNIVENEMRITDGSIRISHTSTDLIQVNAGDRLFTLEVSGQLSNDLETIAANIASEIYKPEGTKSIELERIDVIEESMIMAQNSPNPWSIETTIDVVVPTDGDATLTIYDLQNRVIYEQSRYLTRGTHSFKVSNEQVPLTGMYFYEIQASGQRTQAKMLRVN